VKYEVVSASFFGDPNIGLYCCSSEELCFCGKLERKELEKLKTALKVEVSEVTISNTSFIGLLAAMNSNGIIIPHIIEEKELKKLKKVCKERNMNVLKLDTNYTAIGNLVLCNDSGAVLSPLFSRNEVRKIEDVLGVEVVQSSIADLMVVGSCGIATNKGCLLHRDSSEENIKLVEEVLNVEADVGTLNFGSPFVGACGIANSKGAIVGEGSTGPEITRLQEALGFL